MMLMQARVIALVIAALLVGGACAPAAPTGGAAKPAAGAPASPAAAATSAPAVAKPAAATTAAAPAAKPAGAPLKIGAAFALTGPLGSAGVSARDGARLAEEQINAAGGVSGRPVELVVCDTRGEEAQAVTCARQLIQDDKVIAVLGGIGTPESLALSPITDENNTAQFAIGASRILVDPVRKALFRGVPGSEEQLEFLAQYMRDRGITRVAMLNDSNAFGQDGTRLFQEIAPRLGLQIVGSETYGTADTDMTTQLTRLNATNPQMILNWGTVQGAAIILKNAQQLGMTNIPFITGQGTITPAFFQLAGDAQSLMLHLGSKFLVADELAADDVYRVRGVEFNNAFRQKFNRDADTFASAAYDAMYIVADAARRAGAQADQAAAVRDQVEQTHGLQGLVTIWNFSPTDHGGQFGPGMLMIQARNGKWTRAN